ncbi:hypothetical protein AVEN_190590-1 [Araneus ventricosus]|uniref:DDE-1 domain-containing protein n=1 Tax=Araneus ventricosus TaxID=182803 RepID=A0A4Y2CEK0_ARAVE|nr:hypothetical protein AVEN_190590-1 [Araneus ventricosus]
MINEAWESVPEHTLKRSWQKLAPYLENVDQSNDSGSIAVTELNGLLQQFLGCGNCKEDDISLWLNCDAFDDAGFQLMSDDEIIAQVRKPNSDDNSKSDEGEVIKTSKINNSDAFECFAKRLMWLEQQTDSDSTELMLLGIEEEKLKEIITDISDEIYTECIEGLSTEISESTMKEEWDKKVEYEDALEKMRAVLAKKTIYKWRLFCERRKQRRMFQNTEPLSPWIPMLTNTEYITSGASSPFSVYKKHCSLSRLTDTKLKQRYNRPGWESFTSSQFEMLNKLPRFPPAYLKKVGINRFFKLCVVFASYPNYSLSTFIDWICKKFKLSALSGNLDKKSNLLSFYTLNGGKTLMCIQAIVLEKNMDLKNINLLNGLSAMLLCVPGRFPDSLDLVLRAFRAPTRN